MNFLKKLFGGFQSAQQKEYYIFQVKCKRCGEVIEGRIDVDNDLSVEYEDEGNMYYCRKVLMGSGHCYQKVEAAFKFDSKRKLLERRVESGGDFVE